MAEKTQEEKDAEFQRVLQAAKALRDERMRAQVAIPKKEGVIGSRDITVGELEAQQAAAPPPVDSRIPERLAGEAGAVALGLPTGFTAPAGELIAEKFAPEDVMLDIQRYRQKHPFGTFIGETTSMMNPKSIVSFGTKAAGSLTKLASKALFAREKLAKAGGIERTAREGWKFPGALASGIAGGATVYAETGDPRLAAAAALFGTGFQSATDYLVKTSSQISPEVLQVLKNRKAIKDIRDLSKRYTPEETIARWLEGKKHLYTRSKDIFEEDVTRVLDRSRTLAKEGATLAKQESKALGEAYGAAKLAYLKDPKSAVDIDVTPVRDHLYGLLRSLGAVKKDGSVSPNAVDLLNERKFDGPTIMRLWSKVDLRPDPNGARFRSMKSFLQEEDILGSSTQFGYTDRLNKYNSETYGVMAKTLEKQAPDMAKMMNDYHRKASAIGSYRSWFSTSRKGLKNPAEKIGALTEKTNKHEFDKRMDEIHELFGKSASAEDKAIDFLLTRHAANVEDTLIDFKLHKALKTFKGDMAESLKIADLLYNSELDVGESKILKKFISMKKNKPLADAVTRMYQYRLAASITDKLNVTNATFKAALGSGMMASGSPRAGAARLVESGAGFVKAIPFNTALKFPDFVKNVDDFVKTWRSQGGPNNPFLKALFKNILPDSVINGTVGDKVVTKAIINMMITPHRYNQFQSRLNYYNEQLGEDEKRRRIQRFKGEEPTFEKVEPTEPDFGPADKGMTVEEYYKQTPPPFPARRTWNEDSKPTKLIPKAQVQEMRSNAPDVFTDEEEEPPVE